MKRLAIALFLTFFNSYIYAQTGYMYSGRYGDHVTAPQPSKTQACQRLHQEVPLLPDHVYYNTGGGTTGGSCFTYKPSTGATTIWGTWERGTFTCEYGATAGVCNPEPSCPPGQKWDNTLNPPVCVAQDACLAKAGQSTGFKINGNHNDPNSFYQPAGQQWTHSNQVKGDSGGCNATVLAGTRCTVYGNGDFKCTGNAVFDGTSGDGEAPPPDTEACTDCPDEPAPPTSTSDSECSQWVTDAEGRRTRTCETSAKADQPGKAKCLTDGSLKCVAAEPTPQTDTKTRVDDVKETPTADGGKKTETTSTTTKTYCAAGACTTTNTTNKTTVVTNGNGEVTSETGTCTGDDCAEPQTPEEEKDEAPAQAELPEVGEDGDPSYSDSLDNFIDRVNGSPLISAVNSIAFPSGGGSCNMGSASLWGGSISFNSFCSMAPDILGGLRFLFLSIWAIAAVRLFMTA